jgi:hypothetical protein
VGRKSELENRNTDLTADRSHTLVTTMLDAGVSLRDVQIAARDAESSPLTWATSRSRWRRRPSAGNPRVRPRQQGLALRIPGHRQQRRLVANLRLSTVGAATKASGTQTVRGRLRPSRT